MNDQGARSARIATRRNFDPSKSPTALLDGLLGELLGGDRPADLVICLRDAAGGDRPTPAIWAARPDRAPAPEVCGRCPLVRAPDELSADSGDPVPRLACRPTAAVPIGAGPPVGFVTSKGRPSEAEFRRRIAEAVASLAGRIALDRRFRLRFGRDSWLVGGSETLDHLEAFLDRSRRSDLPVLFLGAPGSGRGDAARVLHLMSGRAELPFVVIDGSVLTEASFIQDLSLGVSQAGGGTVFLASIDELDGRLQSRLAGILNQGLAHWWTTQVGTAVPPPVRVAASARFEDAADPSGRQGPRLHPALRAELGFLSFHLLDMSDRRDDVTALALLFLRRYGSPRASLAPEIARAFEGYRWPGNIPEIRWVAARLASVCGEGETGAADLAKELGELLEATRSLRLEAVQRPDLVRACAQGRFEPATRGLNPVLGRALAHISTHLADPVSLGGLARIAYVSASHLSHLFKHHLGMSPMSFVARVRIERAKMMLVGETAMTIHQVAGRVGFGDLRHFERSFKRFVGSTPRRYRLLNSPA